MQIKTTMTYHFTCVRMAIITKSINNKCWRRWGKKKLFACLMRLKIDTATVKQTNKKTTTTKENCMKVPQKLKNRTTL